ncbi:hypothetical protein FIU89_00395 [Roseovarius sp. THAF27]|uniref:hypothetical protein n=1 Tax=Roseovarius sp. THAF27 TaxID=2587850 RepID=UPI0012A89EB3|nr:hypothetical protein [Roseovarius sp. THAF27]QFT79050.1 hypothetical protein FIU89_00395 [Roseovarius sp. THAF27]
MTNPSILRTGFDTRPIEMQPMWALMFQAPSEDVDRIFDAVTQVAPLTQGKTDRNGYRAPGGLEYYRPREGTPTGAEDDTRHRPGVDEMRFFLPRDPAMLTAVIEAIYAVHSYYEPVITVTDVLRSQCKGLDDSDNPHRWWNRDGDWKTSPT